MNTHPTLRVLSPDDAAVLNRVAEDVFDEPIDQRWTAEFLSDSRHHIVVAIVDEEVVGMVTGVHYVHPDKPPALWVNEMGVSSRYQRQGVGKLLMHEMFALGRRLGCTEAWLGTEPENTAARRLYASVGGEEQTMIYFTFELERGKDTTAPITRK